MAGYGFFNIIAECYRTHDVSVIEKIILNQLGLIVNMRIIG